MIKIELNESEVQVIKQVLKGAPVSGTLTTLPSILAVMAGILKKLEEAPIMTEGDSRDNSTREDNDREASGGPIWSRDSAGRD